MNIEISKSIMDKRHWVQKCQDRSWSNGKKRPAGFPGVLSRCLLVKIVRVWGIFY